jgi:hypothetical protein
MSIDALSIAARQHGLAHEKQLAAIGLSRSARHHLLTSGRWIRRTGHVIQLAGAPRTPEQDAALAVLDLGEHAALSHHSAAARWDIPGFALRPFHVTGNRLRGRNGLHAAVIHQPRLLLAEHILILDGIATTSPTRTMFDLAGVLHPKRTERALESALRQRLTTIRALRRMLTQLAKRGRPGIRVMRALLDERPLDYIPTGSGLELRFLELARRAGITSLVCQLDIGDDYDWIGRVDFVDRKRRIVVEVQSDRFHGSLVDTARDAERIGKLTADGWTVIEVHEHDVWHDPESVVRRLRTAFW